LTLDSYSCSTLCVSAVIPSHYIAHIAIKLQLQQPNLEKDEYYFQSACDGLYVVISAHSAYQTRLELTADVSQATLFGLTQCHPPRLPASKLQIGSKVLFRWRDTYYDWVRDCEAVDYDSEAVHWVRGRVRDRRHTAFGYEISIDYHGVICEYGRLKTLSGQTRWIPLTSYDLDFEQPNDHRVRHLLQLSKTERTCPQTAWNVNGRGATDVCDAVLRECDVRQDRFEYRVKSRRRWNSKGKRKQERSNANDLRSRRRTQRKGKKYVKAITHRIYVS